MRLEKEFVVGAPLERAWRALSDLEVFASCIPGGELQPSDGAYTGRIGLGPNGGRVECEATVRSVDQDEDEHVATVVVHGRQVGGPGVGSVTVQSRCQGADTSTRVVLTADVLSSGFEHREAFAEAARELFERAADLLAERATTAPPPAAAAQPAAWPGSAGARLPVPAPTQKRLQRGLALAGGAVVAVVVVRRLLGRRRGGLW
jgi:carbon monoxide dehydrogenase subunit G